MVGALALCLLLTGCHAYRWQLPPKHSLAVPFIEGESDGLFTATLVEVLARHGVALEQSASWSLHVQADPAKLSNVGYTYGYSERGRPIDWLYPNEARQSLKCRVWVSDQGGRLIVPPELLQVSSELDFQIDEIPYEQMQYSAGQLSSRDEATASNQVALQRKMAEAIATWLLVRLPSTADKAPQAELDSPESP